MRSMRLAESYFRLRIEILFRRVEPIISCPIGLGRKAEDLGNVAESPESLLGN